MTLTEAASDRSNWNDPTAECEGDEPWHGTPNGYRYHGCRGPACREAGWSERAAQRVSARSRALTRLGRRHPDELAELIAEELRR